MSERLQGDFTANSSATPTAASQERKQQDSFKKGNVSTNGNLNRAPTWARNIDFDHDFNLNLESGAVPEGEHTATTNEYDDGTGAGE